MYYVEFYKHCLIKGFTHEEAREIYKRVTTRDAIKPSAVALTTIVMIILCISMCYAAFHESMNLFILTTTSIISISSLYKTKDFKNETEYLLAIKVIEEMAKFHENEFDKR